MDSFEKIDLIKLKDSDSKILSDKENVGAINDTALEGGSVDSVAENPAVQFAIQTDVFTSNQLYGSSVTGEDLTKIGQGASLFTSPQMQQTTNTTSTSSNSVPSSSNTTKRSDIQRTATASALIGVTDKGNTYTQSDSASILKNLYDEYNKQLKNQKQS